MPITIGSNIASLRARRLLDVNTAKHASVTERLSSGQRINRPSDDPAGLATASALNVKTRVYTKALANVNDGISYLSIADGALAAMSSVLTRLTELAEQASNGTYGASQREALDDEAQALRLEYARIQQTTDFNGIRPLSLSAQPINIQVGTSGTDQQIAIGLGTALTSADNSLQLSPGSLVTTPQVTTQTTNVTLSVWAKLDDVNQLGVLAYVGDSNANGYGLFVHNGSGVAGKKITLLLGGATYDAMASTTNINGDTWTNYALVRNGTNWEFYINGTLTHTGTQNPSSAPTLGFQTGASLVGNVADARMYERALSASEIAQLAQGVDPSSTGLRVSLPLNDGGGSVADDISGNGFDGVITGTATWTNELPDQLTSSELRLRSLSLIDAASARSSLDGMTSLLQIVSKNRGTIGAQLSRLSIAGNHLTSARLATTEAAHRITDADTAADAAELVRSSILQEMGAKVLAQANQSPLIALKLLKN